jgi:hypothetical protein
MLVVKLRGKNIVIRRPRDCINCITGAEELTGIDPAGENASVRTHGSRGCAFAAEPLVWTPSIPAHPGRPTRAFGRCASVQKCMNPGASSSERRRALRERGRPSGPWFAGRDEAAAHPITIARPSFVVLQHRARTRCDPTVRQDLHGQFSFLEGDPCRYRYKTLNEAKNRRPSAEWNRGVRLGCRSRRRRDRSGTIGTVFRIDLGHPCDGQHADPYTSSKRETPSTSLTCVRKRFTFDVLYTYCIPQCRRQRRPLSSDIYRLRVYTSVSDLRLPSGSRRKYRMGNAARASHIGYD